MNIPRYAHAQTGPRGCTNGGWHRSWKGPFHAIDIPPPLPRPCPKGVAVMACAAGLVGGLARRLCRVELFNY